MAAPCGKAAQVLCLVIIAATWAAAARGSETSNAPSQAYYEAKVKEIQRTLESLKAPRAGKVPQPGKTREKEASENASRKRGIWVFQDTKGVTTLTNRPDLYKRRKGYREVFVAFDPITVPDRFRKYHSPYDYVSNDISELVRHYASRYGLDEALVHAVIRVESNYEPYAVSSAGARGLMQVMPGTGAEMGATDLYDPAQNIGAGTQYLSKMLELFNRDKRLALAAYNAGPESVKNYNGIPPYPETVAYVRNVIQREAEFRRNGVGSVALAKAERRQPTYLPGQERRYYTVYLKSGYTQPAEKVVDRDPYYCLQFRGRMYSIRKDLVERVVKPA